MKWREVRRSCESRQTSGQVSEAILSTSASRLARPGRSIARTGLEPCAADGADDCCEAGFDEPASQRVSSKDSSDSSATSVTFEASGRGRGLPSFPLQIVASPQDRGLATSAFRRLQRGVQPAFAALAADASLGQGPCCLPPDPPFAVRESALAAAQSRIFRPTRGSETAAVLEAGSRVAGRRLRRVTGRSLEDRVPLLAGLFGCRELSSSSLITFEACSRLIQTCVSFRSTRTELRAVASAPRRASGPRGRKGRRPPIAPVGPESWAGTRRRAGCHGWTAALAIGAMGRPVPVIGSAQSRPFSRARQLTERRQRSSS